MHDFSHDDGSASGRPGVSERSVRAYTRHRHAFPQRSAKPAGARGGLHHGPSVSRHRCCGRCCGRVAEGSMNSPPPDAKGRDTMSKSQALMERVETGTQKTTMTAD